MNDQLLGSTGLRVLEACLGTMTFGASIDWGAGRDDAYAIYKHFRDAGGNFIDTADIYTGGESETLLGEFIDGHRSEVVLATKYTDAPLGRKASDPNAAGNHRKHMVEAVHASLERLGTDYVDLLYVHAWDFLTPVEEVMRALDDLVRQGNVLYTGISDTPAWVISRANAIAEAGRLDSAPFHALSDRNLAIADAVIDVADATGHTPAQVVLAWVCRRGVLPIFGATQPRHVESNLKSLELSLDEEHLAALNDATQIDLGFPHDFLEGTRAVTYGGYDDIQAPRRGAPLHWNA